MGTVTPGLLLRLKTASNKKILEDIIIYVIATSHGKLIRFEKTRITAMNYLICIFKKSTNTN